MSHGTHTISTHILDTGAGMPAAGIRVTLAWLDAGGGPTPVGEGRTDDDGRIEHLLHGSLVPGRYELTFHLDDQGTFFRRVTLVVAVEDVSRSYHVPLLLAPYSVGSYRGS